MNYFLFLIFSCFVMSANAADGKIRRSTSETNQFAPNAIINYDRDCNGLGKPKGMYGNIVSASSGVGSVLTITETDGTNTWITTVGTSVANTTTVSCSQLQ